MIKLPFCGICPNDPSIRKSRGCDGPAQGADRLEAVPGEKANEICRYRSCPAQFVPATVSDWWERRLDVEKFPHIQVPYRDRPMRDRAFDQYFNACLERFPVIARLGLKRSLAMEGLDG